MQPRRSPSRRSLRSVSAEACVGIVANPASGRDIRRLVAGASVFGNADKAGMVFRLLAGLGAAGVQRALMLATACRPRCAASSTGAPATRRSRRSRSSTCG
jgi:predicted polyphosphate/ATP-dependent NAD kinase